MINSIENTGVTIQKPLSLATLSTLLIAHIGLALVARSSVQIATLYAFITFGFGLYYALFSKNSKISICITAYIVGAEVFWRMTNANIFYESGKYFIIVILLIGILRRNRIRNVVLPFLYFLLLCLSIPLTIFARGLSQEAQQMISFNLSGPLALAVCVLYFSQVKLRLEDLQKIAWGIALPVISILTLAASSTITAGKINFTGESNFITSGGFGPNQVSAILGLGAVMMFMIVITVKKTGLRLVALGLMLVFLAQSALTFSRGGIYNAAICILLAAIHFILLEKGKSSIIVLVLALAVLAGYLVYPQLDQFTGGMLTQRLQDVATTGREQIAQADITIWQQNVLLGVGPGVAGYETAEYFGKYAAAHTEYTRLLAEHGIPGILALGLLFIMAFRAYFQAPGWQSKLWAVVLIAWSLAEMSHAAMRIAAISLLFGLANAVWVIDLEPELLNKIPLKIDEIL